MDFYIWNFQLWYRYRGNGLAALVRRKYRYLMLAKPSFSNEKCAYRMLGSSMIP